MKHTPEKIEQKYRYLLYTGTQVTGRPGKQHKEERHDATPREEACRDPQNLGYKSPKQTNRGYHSLRRQEDKQMLRKL